MKTEYLGQWLLPNGYNYPQIPIHVVWDPETKCILHVVPTGFHKSAPLPMEFESAAEALWNIQTHPMGRLYYGEMTP